MTSGLDTIQELIVVVSTGATILFFVLVLIDYIFNKGKK